MDTKPSCIYYLSLSLFALFSSSSSSSSSVWFTMSLSFGSMIPIHSSLASSSLFGTISLTHNKSLINYHHHHHRIPGTAIACISPSSSSNSPPSSISTQKNILLDQTSSTHPNYKLSTDPSSSSNPAVIDLTPESTIERVIFDFRFLALLAVAGSLAGSLLCFLNGCVYVVDAYKVYWTSCVKGVHGGQMVLRLVEAIDVYLAGTVMLIFGMGLYGLFISNVPPGLPPNVDRAIRGSSLFGMFALKERPKWMKISSLDELKTKVGHVIVMILLVKMFERSKMVVIATGMDLLSYSVCIFLSSASLYILHNLHKSD